MMSPRRFDPDHVRYLQLQEVASVRTGFTPQLERKDRGLPMWAWGDSSHTNEFVRRTVLMIQPSMVTDEGRLDWLRLDRINVPPSQSIERHALHPGAVLLCLRGVLRACHITAEVLDESPDVPGERLPVVASSAWAVIYPMEDVLDSSYLTWHLVQAATQKQLRHKRIGSALAFVPLRTLQETVIPLPSLREQQSVARAAELINQIDQLERQRNALLRKYLHGSLRAQQAEGHVAHRRSSKSSPRG